MKCSGENVSAMPEAKKGQQTVNYERRRECFVVLSYYYFMFPLQDGCYHRRRIKTEEKAKVVATVGGKEFI